MLIDRLRNLEGKDKGCQVTCAALFFVMVYFDMAYFNIAYFDMAYFAVIYFAIMYDVMMYYVLQEDYHVWQEN